MSIYLMCIYQDMFILLLAHYPVRLYVLASLLIISQHCIGWYCTGFIYGYVVHRLVVRFMIFGI